MKNLINCACCDGTAKLNYEKKESEYRKEKFEYKLFYYQCPDCSEDFTTDEVDAVSINQVYNQYREKHNLLFPEDLLVLRENYGLSAVKMSQVLGLGINTYSNYEKGEVPTLSNSNLIKSAQNLIVFSSFLETNKTIFSENTYKKILSNIQNLKDIELNDDSYLFKLNIFEQPSKFTGYRSPNIKKIQNLILYFLSKCNSDYNDKLKLNKLLFYADFLNYKITGKSITGLSYRAIQYGPIPSHYENLFSLLSDKDKIIESTFVRSKDGNVYEKYSAVKEYDLSLFTESEQENINEIIDHFKDIPTWDLVDLSHKEKAWIDLNGTKEIIDYQKYAFELNKL